MKFIGGKFTLKDVMGYPIFSPNDVVIYDDCNILENGQHMIRMVFVVYADIDYIKDMACAINYEFVSYVEFFSNGKFVSIDISNPKINRRVNTFVTKENSTNTPCDFALRILINVKPCEVGVK